METYDTYCLVPDGKALPKLLDELFRFEDVVYHDGVDHVITSGSHAAALFASKMRNGSFLRFHVALLPDTEGGWLYRLDDGNAVIGLSGSVHRPGAALTHLQQLVPDGWCVEFGDQPPPSTAEEFIQHWRVAKKRSNRRKLSTALLFDVALVLTLWSLLVNNITLTSNDYTGVVIQAVVCSSLALVLLIAVWLRSSRITRFFCLLVAVPAAWTLLDAAGRRLPAILQW